MSHRILVLGAGYVGTLTTGMLARRLLPQDATITLVNEAPDLVERVRLHQLATGQDIPVRPLAEVFAGTAVALRIDRVTGVDADAHRVHLARGGDQEYDSLVVALGSSQAPPPEQDPGTTVHALADRDGALRLRGALGALAPGGRISVVGAGPTGLEIATEIAESRPDLQVTLFSAPRIGADLSPRGAAHVRRVLTRLGIRVREGVRILQATPEAVQAADGSTTPTDLVIWATGFVTSPLAAASGLETSADGRIVVERTMRSRSHPEVHAIGDAAWAQGPGGKPLRMCCASGTAMGWQAAEGLLADLHGRRPPQIPLRYAARCLSLGRREGLIQVVRPDDTPVDVVLTGRADAWSKERVCRGAAFATVNPTFRLPVPARALAR